LKSTALAADALYGFFHSTRYPWPGIELEKKQRDFASLADPHEIKRIQQEREAVQKELDNAVKQAKKDRDAAKGDARKMLDEVVKQAEDAARVHAAQPFPYETFYAVVDAQTIEDVAVQLKGDPAKTSVQPDSQVLVGLMWRFIVFWLQYPFPARNLCSYPPFEYYPDVKIFIGDCG
jgi:hypothetical protein